MKMEKKDLYRSFGMTLREKRELQGIEHGPQSPGPKSPKTKHEGWVFALQPPDRTGGVPGFNLNPESPVKVYAVLERGSLVLYPGKPSHAVRSAEQTGQESISDKLKVIVLSRGCILHRLDPADAKGHQFAFFVSDGRRAIILIAESEERAMAWMRKIDASSAESRAGGRGSSSCSSSSKAVDADAFHPEHRPCGAVPSPRAGVGHLSGRGGRVLNGRYFDDEEEEDQGMLDAAAALDASSAHQRPSAPSMTPSLNELWHLGDSGDVQQHHAALAAVSAGMPQPTAPSLHRLGGHPGAAAAPSAQRGAGSSASIPGAGQSVRQKQAGELRDARGKGVCGLGGEGDEEDEKFAAAVRESLRHANTAGGKHSMDENKSGASQKASSRYRKDEHEDEGDEEAIMLETALRESAMLSEAEASMPGRATRDEDEQDASNLKEALIASQSQGQGIRAVDQGSVARLEGMGFERSRIIKTLGLTGGDCEAAIDMLLL